MGERVNVHIERHPWRGAVGLYLYKIDRNSNDVSAVLSGYTFKEVHPSMSNDDQEVIDISEEAAQVLADRLWDLGFRPTEGKDRAEVVTAQKDHIKDLRDITTRLLGMVKG